MITTNLEEENYLRGKRCLRCAAWFEYRRCSKKYCSDSCKQIAYLQRKTEVERMPKKKVGFFKRIINWLFSK